MANILDDSRAATLLKHELDRFDVEVPVVFAEEMLRRIATKMQAEPYPKAEAAAEAAVREYRPPATDVSPFDRKVLGLVVRELDRLDSEGVLGRRTPFKTLARKIAAEVLDLPEHTVRRLLR